MSEDIFRGLKRVGEREAAQRDEDERWTARAAGRGDVPAADDDEATHMAAATAPRDSAYLDAMTAKALAATHGKASATGASGGGRRSKVVRLWPWIALPAAAAAAAALWFANARPRELPEYALVVTGPDRAVRAAPSASEPGDRRTLSDGALLSVVLRPAAPPTGAVQAWAWVEGAGPRRAAGVVPRIEPSGAVIVEGDPSAVFGDARGDVDLVVAVAPGGALDGSFDAARRASTSGQCRLLRVPLHRPR